MVRKAAVITSVTAFAAVPESDAYPMIEYWKANDYRANPLCDISDTSSNLLTTSAYPYRKSLGLKQFSSRLLDAYAAAMRVGSSDIVFDANQRRLKNDYDTIVNLAMKKTVSKRRSGQDGSRTTPNGFGAELCDILHTLPVMSTPPAWSSLVAGSRRDIESFCNTMAGVTKDVYCQDNYSYIDPSTTYAGELGGDVAKVDDPMLPESCYSPVTGIQDPIELSIQQFRDTPDSLDWNAISAGEKKVYYLLWKSIDNLEKYAERKLLQAQLGKADPAHRAANSIHDLFADHEIFDYLLPQWKMNRIIYTNEASSASNVRVPLAAVSSRSDDNMLVTLRRSLTNFDSRFALYNQLSFKYLYNFTGQLQDGSATYFQSLLSPIVFEVGEALKKLRKTTVASRDAPLLKLTITAADMPGIGAAAALGNHISRQYGTDIQVDVVLFGNPYFGDQTLLDSMINNVELRVIQMEGDSTDLVSCPQTISCDNSDLYIRTGVESGVVYDYKRAHGYVKIPLSVLGRLDDAWLKESSIFQLAAIRDCGYACALSNYACAMEHDNPDTRMCDPAVCQSFIQL